MRVEILLIISLLCNIGICAICLRNLISGAKALKKIEELEKKGQEIERFLGENEKKIEEGNKELKNLIQFYQNIKEEEIKRFYFEPYYIYVPEEGIITDEGKELVKNAFYLVVYEKDGMGELFTGEGKVDLALVCARPQYSGLPKALRIDRVVDIKNGPSQGYHTVVRLPAQSIVEIVDYFGNWAKIKMSDGSIGYFCLKEFY